MSLKRFFGDLLIMTRAERNGVIVLLMLITIVLAVRMLVPVIFSNEENYLEEIEQKIAQIESVEETKTMSADDTEAISITWTKRSARNPVEIEINKQLFKFDPNTVSRQELNQLGFSNKVASTLLNYREKGGTFRKKADLLKIYGLDTLFYEKLESYISIKRDTVMSSLREEFKSVVIKNNKPLLEINSVDSAGLTTLPGIGPVFAKRICTFREYLGGFVAIDQLKEVYHLPAETFNQIRDQLIIDTTLVDHINVNFADVNELKKHPYCNFEMAKRVVNYRSIHGSYSSVNKLCEDSILSMEEFSKIAPYLTVN